MSDTARGAGPAPALPEARRVRHSGRVSVLLSNGSVRAAVDLLGSVVPEFSRAHAQSPGGRVNAHWVPPFRGGEEPWSEEEHARFWKVKLLHLIAGDFLCCPSFGPGCVVDGASIPPHGWSANEDWELLGLGADARSARADFRLDSPEPAMPLTFLRRDMVLAGEDAYWSLLAVRNRGTGPIAVNVGRHNTLGAPFLAPGCVVGLSARRFATPPAGTEFDATGRLAVGAQFTDLGAAPLRSGGTADLRRVPGMIGHTDFVTGPVPRDSALGWSCVTSPELGLAYLCLFPGPAGLPEGELALSFNELWMQYGGRPFTPWAETEGGKDRTFCLGTENATGAYANGLAWAREHPELLGSPTTVEIPAGGERRLCYGVALLDVGTELAAEGVVEVEAEGQGLALKGPRRHAHARLSADFGAARRGLAELSGSH